MSLFRTNYGVFAIFPTTLFWKIKILWMWHCLAHLQSWMLYNPIGFKIWLYRSYLLCLESLEFLPNSQYIFLNFTSSSSLKSYPKIFAVFSYGTLLPFIVLDFVLFSLTFKSFVHLHFQPLRGFCSVWVCLRVSTGFSFFLFVGLSMNFFLFTCLHNPCHFSVYFVQVSRSITSPER